MKKHCLPIVLFVLVSLLTTLFLPATAAYAFSLQDLVGQASAPTVDKNSSVNIVDVLVGLLLGKLLGKKLDLPAATSGGSVSLPGGLKSTGNKEVVGFYAEWYGTDKDSYNDFNRHIDQIQTIAPFWATLAEDGTVSDRGGDDHQSVVTLAHQNHRSVYLLVNNATKGNTDVPIDTLLNSPKLRTIAIDNLEATVKKYHLDGINIDFEMVPAKDRDNLSLFMKELSARLKPQGVIVSMDVFPKENEDNDVSVAYDYASLANYVDKIMLMTYDNHGTWSEAGPIADIGWDERCVNYALQFIPKNKLYLGIAGYGYDWSSKGTESLEYPAIMNLAKQFSKPIEWDESSKSPHLSYTGNDGINHQVWFENSQSIGYKVDLMNKYDLGGIALWKLGEEDPAIWSVIQGKLGNK